MCRYYRILMEYTIIFSGNQDRFHERYVFKIAYFLFEFLTPHQVVLGLLASRIRSAKSHSWQCSEDQMQSQKLNWDWLYARQVPYSAVFSVFDYYYIYLKKCFLVSWPHPTMLFDFSWLCAPNWPLVVLEGLYKVLGIPAGISRMQGKCLNPYTNFSALFIIVACPTW